MHHHKFASICSEHETLLQVCDFHPERRHSLSHRSNLDLCELQARRRSWILWNLNIYDDHILFGRLGSGDLPGKGLRADPVDCAGEKAVGYCCVPCLHEIHKNLMDKKTRKWQNGFLASIPQVDSLIPPVVAHGVNTISAPFSPEIIELKMSQINQWLLQKNPIKLVVVDILNSAFHTSSSSEGVDVRSRYSLPASQRLCWTHDGLCYPEQNLVVFYQSYLRFLKHFQR